MERIELYEAYRRAAEYIDGIPKFSGKHSMEETGAFFRFLGEPCREQRIIHVAGTNGKGSVCAFLRNILEEAGYHTAVFISPHLVSVRERFLFDGEMVSREEFLRAYQAVADRIGAFREKGNGYTRDHGSCGEGQMELSDYHPSFFEFLFFMFLMMERTQRADFVILETGLGGRLDATNVMPDKLLCIITEIGLDHMEYLGDTKDRIAAEKAGIMREGVPVIYASGQEVSADVIEERARRLHAPAYAVKSCDVKIEGIRDKNIAFSFHSVYYNFINLILTTTALYQVENASLALRAADILNQKGYKITMEQIQKGVRKTHWEGRMEEILPGVYVDGAHNEDGIRAFLETVNEIGRKKKNHLLFAVVQDKQYESMIRMIAQSGLFEQITITKAGGSRGADPEQLLCILHKYYKGEYDFDESAEHAFDKCVTDRQENGLVFAAGSLYLTGRIKAHLWRNSDD